MIQNWYTIVSRETSEIISNLKHKEVLEIPNC